MGCDFCFFVAESFLLVVDGVMVLCLFAVCYDLQQCMPGKKIKRTSHFTNVSNFSTEAAEENNAVTHTLGE